MIYCGFVMAKKRDKCDFCAAEGWRFDNKDQLFLESPDGDYIALSSNIVRVGKDLASLMKTVIFKKHTCSSGFVYEPGGSKSPSSAASPEGQSTESECSAGSATICSTSSPGVESRRDRSPKIVKDWLK